MLPLIIKPAIAALSAPLVEALVNGGLERTKAAALWSSGGEEYVRWARTLFFIPAIAGGVFGPLGGYLTDIFGRCRVRTYSILLYAFSACEAGFATSLPQLLVFRCLPSPHPINRIRPGSPWSAPVSPALTRWSARCSLNSSPNQNRKA